MILSQKVKLKYFLKKQLGLEFHITFIELLPRL